MFLRLHSEFRAELARAGRRCQKHLMQGSPVAFAVSLLTLTCGPVDAEEPSLFIPSKRSSAPASTREELTRPPADAKWDVAIDVQMMAMPQELALRFLPDLQSNDEQKVESAVTQIQECLRGQQATLLGWPTTLSSDGSRSSCETTQEVRYPVTFEAPLIPMIGNETAKRVPLAKAISLIPIGFEGRLTGAVLEADAKVSDDGRRIVGNMKATQVRLLSFTHFERGRIGDGTVVQVDAPRFEFLRTVTRFEIRSGHHALIGIHTLSTPQSSIAFFIAHAVATPHP